MKKRAIIWDLDDVLTYTSESFHAIASATHGKCPHPDRWTDYLWGKYVDRAEGSDLQDYLVKYKVLENSLPFAYTARALSTTQRLGYCNIILSARSWHPNPHDMTRNWARQHTLDSYIEYMHFVTFEEPKSIALERLCHEFDICAFVEDNLTNARSAVDIAPQIYLVDRSWNRHDTDLPSNISRVGTSLDAALAITQLPLYTKG